MSTSALHLLPPTRPALRDLLAPPDDIARRALDGNHFREHDRRWEPPRDGPVALRERIARWWA